MPGGSSDKKKKQGNPSSQRRRRPRNPSEGKRQDCGSFATNLDTRNQKCRKILLLHGNRQTGQILLGRLERLQKRLSKEICLEFIAPDAPFSVPDDDGRQLLTWWDRVENEYRGLDVTLQLLREPEWNNSEVVGIMGFSQGARLAHLLALLHNSSKGNSDENSWFINLSFVILVAGYDAPIPDGFPYDLSPPISPSRNTKLSISSLHVWGTEDPLISPEQSQAVCSQYDRPESHIHTGKHFVPTKASDIQAYLSFVQDSITLTHPNINELSTSETEPKLILPTESNRKINPKEDDALQPPNSTSNASNISRVNLVVTIPDEEAGSMQQDEVQALEAIFPDEISIKSAINDIDGERELEFPIMYHMKLLPADDDEAAMNDGTTNWPQHPLTLEIRYPHNYPSEAIPHFRLLHDNNSYEFPSSRVDRVMNILKESSELELGMPSVLSGIYAVKEYLDSPPDENEATNPTLGNTNNTLPTTIGDNSKVQGDSSDPTVISKSDFIGKPLIPLSSRQAIDTSNLEGLEIAESILLKESSEFTNGQKNPSTYSGGNPAYSTRKSSGGGSLWNYVIGLVGKPSAGKSTFFNAATAFSRQRGSTSSSDDGGGAGDFEWGGASMAAHPFTTINPNIGYCLIPAPFGSCPEDEEDDPTLYASTHGRSPAGRRFLPVLLKDVAGLVPGAYQGRGRGNQFLNDLTDATVLIHVVDASGTADAQGNKTVTDEEASELTNPLDDLAWIRNELVEWVYSNVTAKWDAILRKGRIKLSGMFSGYGQREVVTQNILNALEKFLDDVHQRDRALDNIALWDQADVHRLVSTFLGVRFPMALALNKCDLPSSKAHLKDIENALPIHGAHVGTPMIAREEMTFVRNHLTTKVSDENEQLETVEPCSAPTGVWDCLTSAMALRQPVLVFPVSDMTTYAPLPGLNKGAAENASLPSEGMIRCMTEAGGSPPTCWKYSNGYAVPAKEKGAQHKLRDVLLMKPGATVEDVFFALKKVGAISGEFVRAEAASNIGEKAKPVPKLEAIGRKNRIIKIMSNKRAAWQS